ncbi:hypothetical protein [Streptomyces lunaelactis]|uniref:hypothetical protein n=1 Tax=Streptomyces lunaelactis TaxID=1535768 RepID=UPI0015844D2B|nr:hypothetical protein [Streptomyces lunaelactis]NUK18383.1 hypothetical protein [Streptomyces lunaelactis]
MAKGRTSGQICADLPPGRRALAAVLTELYRHLAVATLDDAAELLASRGWGKDPSEISRYRKGRRKPPFGFVELLHSLAVERAGREAVELTVGKLREIHTAAEPRICRTCTPIRRENARLRSENSRLLASQADQPFPANSDMGASTPLLPVPFEGGDRQRSARDVAAARQLAATAVGFHGSGQTSHAVSWLQDASTALTPLESAASIALLRQEQTQLADTAISIHGRRRTETDVIRIALELHEYGLPDDAGALLRAAIR